MAPVPATHVDLPDGSGLLKAWTALVWIVWSFPIALLLAFHATWLTAWVTLGHQPRPMLDDPKYIGLAVDVPYNITAVLILGTPAMMALGLIFAAAQVPLAKRVARMAALACVWIAVIGWMRWDPHDVFEWFMD